MTDQCENRPIDHYEEIIQALHDRRTIGRVKKDIVPKAIIEKLIEAATWAPSHHNTQPWKFVVMTGEGRAKLGEGYAEVFTAVTGETDEEKRSKEIKKAFRSPVVIAAICSPSDDPRAVLEEELAATQAAVQNLLLAAHAYGLGAIWRSGAPMYHEVMHKHFALREDESIVAFIYIGYAEMVPPLASRRPVNEVSQWLE
ncbi:MAG: nitroreductase [Candidatus Pristimantibacillus lignocellulolyticus]|uniref:Putative NAD(P)H nitroreductase n=1 Tax=Candidatus Pristimantibacillus lignocellulolyticus TaxID=2994561 RepID=A0A9J6ZHA8_9BACL|nr:MAG: nitroreductase [Candidatus Pristimantibacillus lignocellulolyticus]